MSDSNDYDDELQDTARLCQIERPIFHRKRKAQLEKRKQPKVQKPAKEAKPRQSSPLLLIQEEPIWQEKPWKFKTTRRHKPKARYVEYGDPISGYKFIITEQEYKKLKTSEQSVEYIDFHAYDSVNSSDRTTTRANIVSYWEETGTLRLPLVQSMTVDEANTEDINSESVKEFYLRSCSQKAIDYGTILKGERIKWHPDKLVGQTPEVIRKVTRLFQIINELWESHTYGSI